MTIAILLVTIFCFLSSTYSEEGNVFGEEIQKKAAQFNRNGFELFQEKKYEEAIKEFNKAIKIHEVNPVYLYNRGNAYYGDGSYELAKDDFSKAIELIETTENSEHEPLHALLYNMRGTSLFLAKPEEGAKALLDMTKSIELDNEEHPRMFANRGSMLAFMEKYEEALEDYNRAIELETKNEDDLNNDDHEMKLISFHYERGIIYGEIGNFEAGIADFSKIIEIEDSDPSFYLNRASFYFYNGEYEKAIEDCNKAIDLGEQDPSTVFIRGRARYEIGNYQLALEDSNFLLEIVEDSDVFFLRAKVNEKLGNLKEAREDFDKAIKNDDEGTPDYYIGRATFLQDIEPSKSIEDYEKAKELDPQKAEDIQKLITKTNEKLNKKIETKKENEEL